MVIGYDNMVYVTNPCDATVWDESSL